VALVFFLYQVSRLKYQDSSIFLFNNFEMLFLNIKPIFQFVQVALFNEKWWYSYFIFLCRTKL